MNHYIFFNILDHNYCAYTSKENKWCCYRLTGVAEREAKLNNKRLILNNAPKSKEEPKRNLTTGHVNPIWSSSKISVRLGLVFPNTCTSHWNTQPTDQSTELHSPHWNPWIHWWGLSSRRQLSISSEVFLISFTKSDRTVHNCSYPFPFSLPVH